ncbi:MAG: hypothetical protein IPP62_08450 [bacterium]|nr:hypothetical protein [bacterium]
MILHQDADWIAVDKPSGLATHGGHPGELGAVEWLALHRDLETFVVSRLDVATSGVLWLARHREASGRAQRVHEEGLALKTYEFLSAVDARQPDCRTAGRATTPSTNVRRTPGSGAGPSPARAASRATPPRSRAAGATRCGATRR